jgi:hypothetical protein
MTDTAEAVTLGEVKRHLESLSGDVHKIRDKVDDLTSWRDVQRVEDGLKMQLGALEKRIAELEAWKTWTLRTVVGLVIVAGFGLIIAAKSGAL